MNQEVVKMKSKHLLTSRKALPAVLAVALLNFMAIFLVPTSANALACGFNARGECVNGLGGSVCGLLSDGICEVQGGQCVCGRACQLELSIENTEVRPGDRLEFTIDIEHNGRKTVDTPVYQWVEDMDGNVIVNQEEVEDHTLHQGDALNLSRSIEIPANLTPGRYRLMISLWGMEHERGTTGKVFRVVE